MTLTLESGGLLILSREEVVAVTHVQGSVSAYLYVRGLQLPFYVQANQPGVTALFKDLTHGEELPTDW